MRELKQMVLAKTEEDAQARAAKAFEADPESIKLTKITEGNYEATLLDYNAEIEITISADKLAARVADSRPAGGRGRALSFESLINTLSDYGVKLPPLPDAARTLIDELKAGKPVRGLLIVAGSAFVPAKDAVVEPLGDWNYPVFPGDAIAKLIPAQDGVPGKTVTGERIAPEAAMKGKGITFPEDAGCFIDPTSLIVRSELYGLAHITQLNVSCKELISISADAMTVTATIFSKDFRGAPITPERMQAVLESKGVRLRIDTYSLSKAQAMAEEKKAPAQDIVICRGIREKNGRNGMFEMVWKEDSSVPIQPADDGVLDFRARGVVRSVKEGDLLGRMRLPEPGLAGKDVFGKIIPAHDGKPFPMQSGAGVEVSPDGVEYFAKVQGMVHFLGNLLDVTDIYIVNNVNMATGNVVLEKGSLHVKGAIFGGFTVKAPSSILVEEVIEGAVVEAGGDIEVRSGIVMGGKGKITAKGGVQALYAQNATIVAHGDINIKNEIANCVLYTAQRVIATRGVGKIIGSTIRCSKGIEANELGSSFGVQTTIFLGIERRSLEPELKQRRELKSIVQKIYGVLGAGDPRDILVKTIPEKRPAVASMLKARLRAEQKIKDIEAKIAMERKRVLEVSKARIRVHKVIHPGTNIHCLGNTLKVTEPMYRCQISYNPEKEEFVQTPL
jgi:uncharacterized protein (DUF342 family)